MKNKNKLLLGSIIPATISISLGTISCSIFQNDNNTTNNPNKPVDPNKPIDPNNPGTPQPPNNARAIKYKNQIGFLKDSTKNLTSTQAQSNPHIYNTYLKPLVEAMKKNWILSYL